MSSPYRTASPPPVEPRNRRAFDPSRFLGQRGWRYWRTREILAVLAALCFPAGLGVTALIDNWWPVLLALPLTSGLVVAHALYECPACHRHSGISFSPRCVRCGLHVDDRTASALSNNRSERVRAKAVVGTGAQRDVPVDPQVTAILKAFTAR